MQTGGVELELSRKRSTVKTLALASSATSVSLVSMVSIGQSQGKSRPRGLRGTNQRPATALWTQRRRLVC